eukprot:752175-Hanusia_phi.AAC.1
MSLLLAVSSGKLQRTRVARIRLPCSDRARESLPVHLAHSVAIDEVLICLYLLWSVLIEPAQLSEHETDGDPIGYQSLPLLMISVSFTRNNRPRSPAEHEFRT